MIAFSAVQSTIVTLIEAKLTALAVATPSIEGIEVVEDLGTQANEQTLEESLREKGVAIAVLVPVKGKLFDQRAGRTILEVEIPVMLDVNNERNTSGNNEDAAEIGLFTLVKEVVDAVCDAARPINENDRFGLAEDALNLNVIDAGLFRYQLMFTKRCVL